MKILAILGMIILLSLVPTAIISGCQQQPPGPQVSQTSTTQTPSPSPEPVTPPPPTQSPEVPHYEITLVSCSGVHAAPSEKYTELYFSGEVRNDSRVALKGVSVVITSYKGNNDIVTQDKKNAFPWVIQPGETSQFSIRVEDYVNVVRYEVSFEHLEPGILDLSVEPGVSREFWMGL
ncbi:hypothetical protein ACFLYR_03350 [Chloroflexota bacterium]